VTPTREVNALFDEVSGTIEERDVTWERIRSSRAAAGRRGRHRSVLLHRSTGSSAATRSTRPGRCRTLASVA
jgi:hypothetical protein